MSDPADLRTALRACAEELERLRYFTLACPSCMSRVHTADCRLVRALDLARPLLTAHPQDR